MQLTHDKVHAPCITSQKRNKGVKFSSLTLYQFHITEIYLLLLQN